MGLFGDLFGGSTSSISNTVVSDVAVGVAQSSKVSSIVSADAKQEINQYGDDDVVEGVSMSARVAVTQYAQTEAKLDAALSAALSSHFSASASDQQVAVLGALNSSADSVHNMIKNSVATSVSDSTIQQCLLSMNVDQAINQYGDRDIVKGVTMDETSTAVAKCMDASDTTSKVAEKVQNWADESVKQTQTNPLDGLFNALGDLFKTPGEIMIAMIAGGVLIVMVILFLVFRGTSGGDEDPSADPYAYAQTPPEIPVSPTVGEPDASDASE